MSDEHEYFEQIKHNQKLIIIFSNGCLVFWDFEEDEEI